MGDRSGRWSRVVFILAAATYLFVPALSKAGDSGADSTILTNLRPLIGSLSYRNVNYPSKEPYAGPGIKPAYKGGNGAVTPSDTKATEEALISKDIAKFAKSLNWKPVLIYEYIKNNIETEWYWGCMKGAAETLRQGSGNDCDQAALFAALLRASGFPTRYVRGSVEFFAGKDAPISRIRNLLDIQDPTKLGEYFQKAGIPNRAVMENGEIRNYQVEHIWIESLIPYGNYRGTMQDESDPTWLGLDTSIKTKDYVYNTPRDILEVVPIGGLREVYLKAESALMPLEYVKGSIEGFLGKQYPTVGYNDLLRKRTLPSDILKILPMGMQYVQKKITHEYTSMPEELKHKVRFVAMTRSNPPATLFDITIDTMKLSNRQIALSYEPERVEDQEIADRYGGLDNTPSNLVRLRPVLKVDGEMVAAGRDGLPMGTEHDLTIELISPNGVERTTGSHITGNVTAIGITAGRVTPSNSPLPQGGDTKTLEGEGGGEGSEDDDAETIRYKLANRYIDLWNSAEEELATLLHVSMTRPVPTVVKVGGVVDVAEGFKRKGVYLDAAFRTVEVTPSVYPLAQMSDKERQMTFMQLSSLQGSALEHKILEDGLQVSSISTAKLMQIVNAQQAGGGIQIVTLDNTNLETILPTLQIDGKIKEDITNAVTQGLTVKVPNQEIRYKDWQGIGYMKENPQTGEAGYMLSGMINGGMTAESFSKWKDQNVALTMSNPYEGDYTLISIDSPKDREIVTTPMIIVTGYIIDPEAKVLVNGIEAEVEGTTFTAYGVVLSPGMNTIMATAVNKAGITLSDSVTMRYKIPLKTYISFPYDGADLAVSPIDVEGIVSDPFATVAVNGIRAVVSSDGRFIAHGVTLSAGANQITATSTNQDGDTDLSTISVNYRQRDVLTIAITITNPGSSATINRPNVTVRGTVDTTAEEVWIKVNGMLAEVYSGQFVVNSVPLINGENRLVVNAIDSNGATGRAEITVSANTSMPYISLSANITSGIPQLNVYYRVDTNIPNQAVYYEIDFDGNGVVDYSGETFEDITYTYTSEGIYNPVVKVTDDQGNVYTDTVSVIVLNKEKMDALLKGKWEAMKGAMINGDIDNALLHHSDGVKNTYREVFAQFNKMQINAIFSSVVDFKVYSLSEYVAECGAIRIEDGETYSYPVVFVKNKNGIWKIVRY